MIKGIEPKLTASELAAIIKVSPKTVRNGGAGTDEIPREYYGTEIRFDRQEVLNWLERKGNAAREQLRTLRSLKRGNNAASVSNS
jgi:hypothetical protein